MGVIIHREQRLLPDSYALSYSFALKFVCLRRVLINPPSQRVNRRCKITVPAVAAIVVATC